MFIEIVEFYHSHAVFFDLKTIGWSPPCWVEENGGMELSFLDGVLTFFIRRFLFLKTVFYF